ncbi:hypothetical protein BGZ65_007973, partial [Modicella reniformis]
TDHYLNVPFDLSKILFIATANSVETIPAPLLDRMELITIPGYTYAEKLAIATNHLLPKQIRQHGLSEGDMQVTEKALLKVATGYTRESGVRHLEREIGALVRAKAVEYAETQERKLANNIKDDAREYQPLEKFVNEVTERIAVPGVVTGMAYNGIGGGIMFIEVSQMPGKGRLQLTGSLGDVIKESAQIALSWIKSHGYEIGLTNSPSQNVMEKADVHIHMPNGATPKDGPSAGIAMIIMPLRNQKDVTSDVPANVRHEIEFSYVSTIWEVLREAFEGRTPIRTSAAAGAGIDSRL